MVCAHLFLQCDIIAPMEWTTGIPPNTEPWTEWPSVSLWILSPCAMGAFRYEDDVFHTLSISEYPTPSLIHAFVWTTVSVYSYVGSCLPWGPLGPPLLSSKSIGYSVNLLCCFTLFEVGILLLWVLFLWRVCRGCTFSVTGLFTSLYLLLLPEISILMEFFNCVALKPAVVGSSSNVLATTIISCVLVRGIGSRGRFVSPGWPLLWVICLCDIDRNSMVGLAAAGACKMLILACSVNIWTTASMTIR